MTEMKFEKGTGKGKGLTHPLAHAVAVLLEIAA